MYQSIDFFQFQKRFATEARCRNYLLKQRWPAGFICPRCQHSGGTFLRTRFSYQCHRCRYQASATAGTVFHKTRTPLRKWFWMIYLLSQAKNSYSVLGLQKLLKIKRYKTAWVMAHKIRKALADRDRPYQLAGLVEMDDSYFGPSESCGKRGRGSQRKTKVVVSVNVNEWDRPLFVSMEVVPRVDKASVAGVARDKLQPGSTVKTDGWPAYGTLEDHGLHHRKIILGSPEQASKVLPWVHILISNCKAVLRGTHHGVSTKHLPRYLSEFCYRFNRRFWPDQLFERIISACVATDTVTWAELRA